MTQRPYRGKRIDNGEFSFGDLIQLVGNQGMNEKGQARTFIVDNRFGACIDAEGNFVNTEAPFVNEVDPDTVGQYTGLQDDQEVRVFQGDKVIVILTGKVYTVIWDDIGAGFLFSPDGEDESEGHAIDYYDFEDECSSFGFRVIGSIHDHPHLLKGEG